ncbi:fibronectin type III domain-containing protein [Nocardioides antri]|uniref:Fibronectin type III domain-containing protein n=1 Tax=Nocardioides antri TaxID=2607659 RepID=A0A5B1M2Z0_9ACTN|nr:fibronectin type III domain-containing protein [Nocardioides antri]KAA1427585.1 fibronectin type III domain-containing protein [Nocardioides antri]
MSEILVRPSPKRRLVRRLSPVLLVAAVVAAVVGFTAPPASAAAKWNSGPTRYTTITNCPSIIWGNPYQEFGIGAFVSYWGDQQSNPITPVVGETTYLDTYAMRVGSHCSTPIIYPRFVLPAGVEFDRTQAIKCYYTPPGQAQRQVTHTGECPQWQNISANGYYSNSVSGWGGGWPLPSVNGNNGSAWEFLVPIKATSQQFGAQLTTELSVADGNSGPTLNLNVPFYTGPAPVTAPGAPTNVSANATSPTSAQVSFNPPADNGGSAVTGYTARCESPDGGVTQTSTGNASPISVTGLSPSKTYACDVRATNNVGSGSWSTRSGNFSTPAATTAPGVPTNVSATVLSSKSVRVGFNPPANNGGSAITSYRAQCFSPDGALTRVKDGTSSPITLTTLSPATTYRCRVRATNAVGSGSYSPYTADVTTPAAVPSRPTGVTAQALTSTTARVSFPAPADNGSAITSYTSQCVSTNGGTTRAKTGTASPITVGLLSPGKTYHCRVQATNAVGNSAWSAFSSTFTLPAG